MMFSKTCASLSDSSAVDRERPSAAGIPTLPKTHAGHTSRKQSNPGLTCKYRITGTVFFSNRQITTCIRTLQPHGTRFQCQNKRHSNHPDSGGCPTCYWTIHVPYTHGTHLQIYGTKQHQWQFNTPSSRTHNPARHSPPSRGCFCFCRSLFTLLKYPASNVPWGRSVSKNENR